MTYPTTYYPTDAVLIDSLSADDRSDFVKYMAELDAEAAKRGNPYGEVTLWKATGAGCWYDFYKDGLTAAEAIDEDQSCDE